MNSETKRKLRYALSDDIGLKVIDLSTRIDSVVVDIMLPENGTVSLPESVKVVSLSHSAVTAVIPLAALRSRFPEILQ